MPFTKANAAAAAQKSAAARRKPTTSEPPVADERLVRSAAADVRGDRDGSLRSRDEAVETLSDAELDALVASEFEQTALPNAPLIPGYHLCWLTTMSKYDTISKRERLGYTPVRYGDVRGFDPSNGTSATDPSGIVTCNEMVLYKIPEPRYQAIMRHFHHLRPMQEEEAIVQKTRAQQQEDGKGAALLRDGEDEEGTLKHLESSVQYARRVKPQFS